jgi:hypothetical protein
VQTKYNEPTQLFKKKTCMSFFQKKLFDMNEFWKNVFAVFYLINAYSCPHA